MRPRPPRPLRVATSLASGALAATLATGLPASAARAQTPVFLERTGPLNPFDGVLDSEQSAVDLADIDADGDLDMVAGLYSGFFRWVENEGTDTAPDFQLLSPHPLSSFPFDCIPCFTPAVSPAFADLDGDGDLDAMYTGRENGFQYLENTGTASVPAFTRRAGAANPMDGLSVGGSFGAIEFADLDADGDLDAIVGSDDLFFRYFENQGTPTVPAFVHVTGAGDPFDGLFTPDSGADGSRNVPSAGDVDGDGDLDVVVGSYYGGVFSYYENVGTPQSPAFLRRTGTDNPFDGLSVGEHSAPDLADIDGDGDVDMVSGSSRFYANDYFYYEQIAPQPAPWGPWVAPAAGGALLLLGSSLTRKRDPV